MKIALADLVWGGASSLERRWSGWGVARGVLRGVAGGAALLYRAGLFVRERAYRRWPHWARHLPCPVISIGNLTVGGTGKTPAVEWLCRELVALGKRPLIVSRGYGRRDELQNEEAILLAEALPKVPHRQDANRFRAAMEGIREHSPDCVVLDDAFQHWGVHRDLDIVLVDSLDPFGGEHLLPRGKLREPLSALARAQAVILTRSDAVLPRVLDGIMDRVAFYTTSSLVCAVHRPVKLCTPAGDEVGPPEKLAGQKVFLASGIGHPAAFRRTAESLGAVVVGERIYPDHYRYRSRDLDRIRQEAGRADAQVILTTEKDAVKIRFLTDRGGIPIWVLGVRFEIVKGQIDELWAKIRSVVGGGHGTPDPRA